MKKLFEDFSFSTVVAGLIAVLVGYTSSAVIVFQAALAAGASQTEAGSWLGILCVSMGLLTVILSLKYKSPVMFAWSTAGGALLITSVDGIPLPEIVGAFVFSALLIFLCGVTGFFEKIMNRIPVALASSMLAGVLLHFALDVFLAIKPQPVLALSMFVFYLFGRRFFPRFNIVVVFCLGIMVSWFLGQLNFPSIDLAVMRPVYIHPVFSLQSMFSIGIPLFVVTMSSQNLTGIAVMKAHNYEPEVSKLISWSGLTNLVIAPFGGYTINLSALTAAICMGPEAHYDYSKRYTAAVASGLMYIVIGLFSGAIVTLMSSFPKELVMIIAGLALISTINSALVTAITHDKDREAAMITFFVTASGLTLFGVGAAFWGLVAGTFAGLLFNYRKV